jgi:membrane protease YdiL (CAAX protease family)
LPVPESKTRIWQKIGLFYFLTMLFSGGFGAFILHAGRMDAGNLLFVTGSMWSPALAAFATKAIFRESISELPWRWGGTRYSWLAYLIPVAYALPVYLLTWLSGLGAFAGRDFVDQIAKDFGWQNFPGALALALFIIITASLGMVGKISRALGEEIGWRGFLVPELAKVVGFPGVGLISGLLWAAYHYPVLIFADYNKGAPAWFSVTCFTAMVIGGSFILAWLTLRSRSLWPAAIFHASHNLFIQVIFTPMTKDTGPTRYVIDEFGVGLAVTSIIGGLLAWRAIAAEAAVEG